MKNIPTDNAIYKEVVIIGNGPSGIALSYMLAGNLPVVTSNDHPDEMLSMRLKDAVGKSLIEQDLGHLATGLEGRTTNPVSLLLDSLEHPCADIGLELEPLVEWSKIGKEVDHVVLGKGPPGGSWHRMDPHILTLSLGSWMALPGLEYHSRDKSEKRAFASTVAHYYNNYVEKMNLTKHFKNGIIVSKVTQLRNDQELPNCDTPVKEQTSANTSNWVSKVIDDEPDRIELCTKPEIEQTEKSEKTCSLSRALSLIKLKTRRKSKIYRCCKRPRDAILNDSSPDRKIRDTTEKLLTPGSCNYGTVYNTVPLPSQGLASCRNKFFSCNFSCDSLCGKLNNEQTSNTYLLTNSHSLDFSNAQVPYDTLNSKKTDCDLEINERRAFWSVETFDTETKQYVTYLCRYLVLACGASDLPNRLPIFENRSDPSWLVHDVRSLEIKLDQYVQGADESCDPVVVIGAGLSAADAVIATRGRNVPVVHVFRSKSTALNRHLPENMYPEYHKVHQMMKDGGSTYPLYNALPEYTLTDFDENARTVTLTSVLGEEITIKVSFVAVLIGSRPDLSFMPENVKLGLNKNIPVDCKTNAMDLDKLKHAVNRVDNLFAVGPLAGDNFVRFIPGGALAVVSEIYRRNGYM